VTESGTEAMFVWDDARKTVMFCRATVGRFALSERDITAAGYVPPSAGSFGGIMVMTTFDARPGTVEVAAEAGKNWTAQSKRAANSAIVVVFLNFCCLLFDQN